MPKITEEQKVITQQFESIVITQLTKFLDCTSIDLDALHSLGSKFVFCNMLMEFAGWIKAESKHLQRDRW